MNRRDFHRALLGTLGAALLPADARALGLLADPRTVDGERLLGQLRTLSRIGATPEGGSSRVAYSDADLEARERLIAWMREAALATDVDLAGNPGGGGAGRGVAHAWNTHLSTWV